MPDRAARRVLNAWIDRLQPAEEAVARAHWDAACDASPTRRERVESTARLFDAVRHDETGFSRVERSLEEGVVDPTLRRALERMRRLLLPYSRPRPDRLVALEAEAQATFGRYRAEVAGRRLAAHDVARVLAHSTDADELQATWRAALGVGTELAEAVREAARIRNAHARDVGFPDHRALELHVEETDPAFLDAFLDELASGTDAAWQREKGRIDAALGERHGIPDEALRPWHYGDVFFQLAPPEDEERDAFSQSDPVDLARRTFASAGLDVGDTLERSDLLPRDGKHPYAFCAHLDRAGDVRVLANVVPSRRWTRTMLHECGHAAYDALLDLDAPWILVEPPHAAITEGVAMLFERLVHDPRWRAETAGVPAADEGPGPRRREGLVFARWGLVVSRFEEQLYADPEQDLDAAWWGLVERYQGLRRPDPLPLGAWASKVHVACHPAYFHSYLLGAAVAAQLAHHLPDGARLDAPEAGAFLTAHVFRHGAALPWQDLMRQATGHDVTAKWLLEDLRLR